MFTHPFLDETNLKILALLAEDKMVKEIPALVHKSLGSVKDRIADLKEKAGVSSNAALVAYYYEHIREQRKAS